MPPCATVRRERYIHSPGGVTVWSRHRYLGGGLRREEERSDEYMDDFHKNYRRRFSEDNGRTWTQWLHLPDPPFQNGYTLERFNLAQYHDSASGRTLQMVFLRLFEGDGDAAIKAFWRERRKTFFDHMFWEMSADEGRTWSPMELLRYQPGAPFDPDQWGKPEFLKANEMYGGYNVIQSRTGALIYPGTIAARHRHADGTEEPVQGVVCLRGHWDAGAATWQWTPGATVTVPHAVSGQGLVEPTIAELRDGRILMVCRGATAIVGADTWQGKVTAPPRAWMTISGDEGRSWGPVTELRFDTGAAFAVPDALSKLLRSSRTGRLYWFGNLSPADEIRPPRHPLVMAEVEENGPALKCDTVTVIASRDPARENELVQFSNFSLLDNRETGEIELHMPHFGENGLVKETGAFDYTSDTYQYMITPL
jgi:hypothetical protein